MDIVRRYWIALTFLFCLLVFVGAMTNSLFDTVDNLEICSGDYATVEEIGRDYPELSPFIRKICEDGKIMSEEFGDLRGHVSDIHKKRVMKEFKN